MESKYCYNLYSSNATYGSSPYFCRNDSFPGTGYSSVYAVTEDAAKALVAEGTTAGFKGIVWSERLWMDFDSYEAAEQAESKLKEMGYDYIGYDTGGRGGHFGILRTALPSHLLPQRDKQWATDNFPKCDKSIYTHLHPFRLSGTVHEKTGNRKRVVCEQRGVSLVLPPFKRETLRIDTTPGSQRRSKSIFNCYRVMREIRPIGTGGRHQSLVKLIYALRDDAKATSQETLYWCNQWNLLLEEPKTNEEIEKAVQSIYG